MEKLYRRPRLVLIIIGVITVFFALQLPRIRVDNNNLRYIPDTEEAKQTSDWIDETFGSSITVLVGLERPVGTIFDAHFLLKVAEYVREVQEIHAVSSVMSLVSADYITGEGDTIVAEKLTAEDFSGTPEQIAELKERLFSWDLFERVLVSDDLTATQVMVTLDISSEAAGDPEAIRSFLGIRNLAWKMFDGMAEVYVTGFPVFSSTVNEAVRSDLFILIPLVVLVVLAVLFFSFRNFTGVFLPIIAIIVAVIWSVGAMPLLGIRLTIISVIIPVLLVAVGSAYSIHVMTHYIEDRRAEDPECPITQEEHFAMIIALVRKIGLPVFLAALTTFVGFVSFAFTSVIPIREFGLFSAFGVIVSFVMALTLIPCMLLLRGPKPMRNRLQRKGKKKGVSADRLMADFFMGLARRPLFTPVVAALILVVSAIGFSRMKVNNVIVEYFRPNTDMYKSDGFIREKFAGSKLFSVVLTSDDPGALLRPDTLAALDGLGDFLNSRTPVTGKVMGFTDMIKRVNQVFNTGADPDGLPPQKGPQITRIDTDEEEFGVWEEEEEESPQIAQIDGDEDFGDFGDFGEFGGEDEGAWESVPDAPAAAFQTPEIQGETYTVGEIAGLLHAAEGRSASMHPSVRELVGNFMKEVNYQGAAYYEIPSDPARYGLETDEDLSGLISNYLVLLAGNLGAYANDSFAPTAIRTMVQLRSVGDDDTVPVFRMVEDYCREFVPKDVQFKIGGSANVESSLSNLIIQSQIISMVFSLLMVFLIISISNKSAMAGLIGIIPLSISIFLNFGIMGFLGINLNIGTALIASLAVGIGIDYTIHYMDAYRRELLAWDKSSGDFLYKTFLDSGKAILINAIAVGAGFAVLVFSNFKMMAEFGLLVAFTMISSSMVSLTVIPILLSRIKPKYLEKLRKR